MSKVQIFKTKAYQDQKPGTSGLRKNVKTFQQEHYLANFVQSIFNASPELSGGKLILGGDGRYFNDDAVQIILGIAAANGLTEIILGKNAILSTPAVSHLVRKYKCDGGIVLSASHNPAGENGDFGIKFNISNGGAAPTSITEKIYALSQSITSFSSLEGHVNISEIGVQKLGDMTITIIDPVSDFAELMEQLFDFKAIRGLFDSGFEMAFDALSAVTGPYAVEIFEKRLGIAPSSLHNITPLPDFGGGHPDPNPVHAKNLFTLMFGDTAPNMGAASDGDGDRYIILGPNLYVSPSDSVAILAANAHLTPGYKSGIKGVARSMPTSRAVDKVAEALGVSSYETPTGWKYFSNLLEAGRITICGEESAGTSSDHIREKDGLWAILMWLNILAVRGESVESIVQDHWKTYGRHYYTRHDYEAVDTAKAQAVMASLESQLSHLSGQSFLGETVHAADSFTYTDPVDGSVATNQGLRVFFKSGSRFVMRLSGTGTKGSTVRLYLERYESPKGVHTHKVSDATETLAKIADQITNLKMTLERSAPSVIS